MLRYNVEKLLKVELEMLRYNVEKLLKVELNTKQPMCKPRVCITSTQVTQPPTKYEEVHSYYVLVGNVS